MDVFTPPIDTRSTAAPLGYLVPVFAGEDGLPAAQLTIAAAQQASDAGHCVLIVDCADELIMDKLSVKAELTLKHVLDDDATLSDVTYLTPDQAMTVCRAGAAPLETLLGALAAMSLSYDYVFVCPPAGCTPAHIRLAAAADDSLLIFHSAGDRFMRAYWMLDAIRSRAPKCDPLMVVCGPLDEAREAYEMFCATVREFLGAPPALATRTAQDSISAPSARQVFAALRQSLSQVKAA